MNTKRIGYDPYNSHTARKKAGDTVDFVPPDAATVEAVRAAQGAHVLPEGVDWNTAEHVTLETKLPPVFVREKRIAELIRKGELVNYRIMPVPKVKP